MYRAYDMFKSILRKLKKHFFVLLLFFIAINTFLSAWWVFNGDILFHTDIARDFLVLDDIVNNHKITLLGARASGIEGTFHGPLWFYLNVPAFVLGRGNPVVVGLFWVFLGIISEYVLYYVAKRLFDKKTAIVATLLYSVCLIPQLHNLFNPFGAVMLSPLFLYFFVLYTRKMNPLYLLATVFVIGLMIQFQIAFGGPMLALTLLYVVYLAIKKGKWRHLLCFSIIFIPLITYILFDIRHDFLQSRSILHYIIGREHTNGSYSLSYIANRVIGFFVHGWSIFESSRWYLSLITLVLVGVGIYTGKRKKILQVDVYRLFLYLYVGYWLLAFIVPNETVGYYYWPFLPLTLMVIASLHRYIAQRLWVGIIVLVFILHLFFSLQSVMDSSKTIGKSSSSWKYLADNVKSVYRNNDEFGYFVYTPDLLGYTPRYAFTYFQHMNTDKRVYSFEKRRTTILFISSDFYNHNAYNGGNYWRKEQVRITSKPIQRVTLSDGVLIEKYILTDDEMQVKPDPNLIHDLSFR